MSTVIHEISTISALTIHATAAVRQSSASGASGRYRDVRVQISRRAVPSLGPGEVLVRVVQVSVCGSDIHAVQADSEGWCVTSCPAKDWERPQGLVLGHEFSGVVERLGAGVDQHWLDAPVAGESVLPCGTCGTCQVDPNHCPDARLLGLEVDGAFADYVVVPLSALHRIDAICRKLGNEAFVVACLIEPLAVAAKAVDTAIFHLRPGMPRTLLVLGAGPLGAGVAAIARMKGFRVAMAEIDPERRRRAAQFCDLAIDAEAPFVDLQAKEFLGHEGASIVVDACGAAGPRHFSLVRPVGVFLCLARTGSQPKLPIDECMTRGVTISFSRGHVGHFPMVIEWICDGRLDPSAFVTQRLDGLNELATWLKTPARFSAELKVVTNMTRKERQT